MLNIPPSGPRRNGTSPSNIPPSPSNNDPPQAKRHSQAVIDYTKDKATQIAESEKGQEWIKYADEKHQDLKAFAERKSKQLEESEHYQKLKEKAGVVAGKTSEYKDKTKEKAKQLWARGKVGDVAFVVHIIRNDFGPASDKFPGEFRV